MLEVRIAAPGTGGGLVLYIDLLLAQVHLDDLFVLDYLFAQPDLLLEYRPFGDHDLLFEDLHDYLFLTDLGLGGLPTVPRHPLDLDLLALLGDPYLLTLGAYALADLHGAGLAPASTDPNLLLAPLHPEFVGVLQATVALASVPLRKPVRGLGIRTMVAGRGPIYLGVPRAFEAIVAAYPLLEVRRYLPDVAVARAVFDPALGQGGDLYRAPPLVHPYGLQGNQGNFDTRGAHLHADVLGPAILVHEDLVDLPHLRAGAVAHLVPRKPLLEGREPVVAIFVLHLMPP